MKTKAAAFVALAWIAAISVAAGSPLPGQIVIDPENPQWLKREGGGHLYICGPGDPEDFLYRGTRRADGTRDGDQAALIRKLITHGGNSIYLQAVRTHGGDAKEDKTQNPFIDSDPSRAIDERILAQWEEWSTLMDANGILIYFFFYDDGAVLWRTGDRVGDEERTFFETIVRRFQHHRNLIWVVGEEVEERYSAARINALAEIIRRADAHGHVIGAHHNSSTVFKHWMPGGALNHFSMQLTAKEEAAHAGAVAALRHAAGRYQVIYSESTAMPADGDSMRRHAWDVAMGGVMPMLLKMDIAGTAEETLRQCRIVQRFFESTDFFRLNPHDELKHGGTRYVLADPTRSYIAYSDTPDAALGIVDLPKGRGELTWLDCRTGRTEMQTQTIAAAGARAFRRPAGFGAECAVWLRFPDAPRAARAAAVAAEAAPRRPNRAPVIREQRVAAVPGQSTYIQLRADDDDGPGPYTYTVIDRPQHGRLAGDDNDRTYTPAVGFTGRDRFTWRVHDGLADSGVATVTIEIGTRGAATPETNYFPPAESQGGWRKLERPEDVRRVAGMDPAKLEQLAAWLRGSDSRNFAAVVIRRGHLALEVERGNSAKTDARRVASVSKAICATVLAIAAERSQQGLTPHRMAFDDSAFKFIPWAQPLSDPRKARITVRQLLNHASGLGPEAVGVKNEGTWDYVLGLTGDPKTARLAFDPGRGCGYSTHGLHHASLVCEYVTGQPYDQFAIEHLLRPIGCETWWFQFFDGSEKIGRHPSHSIGLPARELARIAYCMLHEGRWGEKQIVPRWFIDGLAASPAATGLKEMRWGADAAHYAEGWQRPTWLTNPAAAGREEIPADARWKAGSGGQFIGYVPSLDLVLTRQTGGSGAWEYEEYLRRACAAVLR